MSDLLNLMLANSAGNPCDPEAYDVWLNSDNNTMYSGWMEVEIKTTVMTFHIQARIIEGGEMSATPGVWINPPKFEIRSFTYIKANGNG